MDRTKFSSPFKSIGIDHLGPSIYKDIDNQDKKFWITLITCLCTRAVYLEPVKNLKTETCLNVLKRLAARRGCPEKILSDNSKTFIACAKTCKINLNIIGQELKWKFIKELSPWQGGIYERIVALVKDAFRKTLGKKSLKWEEMITFTTEVEGILNMRPLTAIEENPDIPGIVPLRPVDFLCPRRNLCLDLEIPRTSESINYSIKYKDSFIYTEFLLNELWKRWKKEYLIWLRDKSQWSMKGPRLQTKREPKIGEIVILEEEFVPRNFWKIVKIVELLDIKDGRCVRNVKILMPNGSIISRPINKLYPLELNIENREIENETENKTIQNNSLENKNNEKTEENKEINKNNTISKVITNTLSNITTTLFIFCLICIMFLGINAKIQCNDCYVECKDKGILINSPEIIDKYEICCSEGPCATHARVEQLLFEIDKDVLITHHHCEVNFWSKNKNLLKYEIKCEPTDLCKLIQCYFCLERMINHTCSPIISIFLISLTIVGLILFCSIFLCLFKNVFKIIRFCFNKGTKVKKMSRSPRRWILKRRLLISLIFVNIINAEMISRTALTENCVRKNGKIDCSWNFVETLTMLNNKVKQSIILKDSKSKILGQINLTPESFKMICEPIVEKYLRSYEVKIQTVKSCPMTGSCHHDNCLIVNNNWVQEIHELKAWENYTGYNRCTASCSFIWCKCGLNTGSSCLFYRIYVEPTDSDIYEIFTCKWIPVVEIKIEKLFIGNETNEKIESIFKLHPGNIVHDSNITLSVTQFSLPPEPDMEEICQECIPDHDNEKVDCKY
uniref:Integrase catalytic domain-containing protein n=1 Tax=Meloidogyne incognita TaxID=6306 RepID=A0A914LD98_MELIC